MGEVIKFAHSMSKVEPETKDLFSIYSYNDCEVETTSGNQKKPIKLKQKVSYLEETISWPSVESYCK